MKNLPVILPRRYESKSHFYKTKGLSEFFLVLKHQKLKDLIRDNELSMSKIKKKASSTSLKTFKQLIYSRTVTLRVEEK